MIVLGISIGIGFGYYFSPNARPPEHPRQMFFAGLSCQEVRGLLPAMMKNDLDAAKVAEVHQHIMQCPECRQLMEQMKATGSLSGTQIRRSGNPPGVVRGDSFHARLGSVSQTTDPSGSDRRSYQAYRGELLFHAR